MLLARKHPRHLITESGYFLQILKTHNVFILRFETSTASKAYGCSAILYTAKIWDLKALMEMGRLRPLAGCDGPIFNLLDFLTIKIA